MKELKNEGIKKCYWQLLQLVTGGWIVATGLTASISNLGFILQEIRAVDF